MMKKTALIYILILSFSHPIFSQTVIKDVSEAIELAKKNNLDLQISRRNAQVQQWNMTAAKGAQLPQLKLTTAFDYNFVLPTQLIPAQFFGGREGEFRSIQFGVPFNLTAGLEGNVPLWNAGLKQEVEMAKANQKIGILQTLVLQDDLSTQVARLYFATVFTQQYITITQQNLANTDSIARIVAERKEKGLIDQLEYNRVRSTRLAIEDVLHQNEMAYQKNLNQLRLVLGDSTATVITSSPNPVSFKEKGGELPSSNEVPRLQLRAAQFSLAKEQVKKEQKLRLPTLSAYARYSEQAQRNQLNFLNFNEKWFGIGVAGLRFEAPIYSGRIRESGIARARVNAEIAQLQLDNEKRKYDSETQDLLITYNQSLNSLKINQEAYQLNEENMKLVLIKYRGGILSYDQYLNVFNEVLNAQNKYLRTLADVMINGKLLEIRNSY
ncbi:TolC family protein [Runella salmonicolor]|uniref:TolC family protein n=1 Tax=Runella salmonicolor TaxID=2950278 RepID=A0ABT1FWQ7_9BACT|nr:TolC family protein [Runella salmonicolor]MCP1386141.1 TolC family protein [Runella salmonicolor]